MILIIGLVIVIVLIVAVLMSGAVVLAMAIIGAFSMLAFFVGGAIATAVTGDGHAFTLGGALAVLLLWIGIGYWQDKKDKREKEKLIT